MNDTRTPVQRDEDQKWYIATLAKDRAQQRQARAQRKVASDEAMRRFDLTSKEGRAAALAYLQAQS